jgi:Cu-Zn family superoxide dismutase
MKAIAVFQKQLSGFVSFTQDSEDSSVRVSGHIRNLPPGKHGFHIHKYGNLMKTDCSKCGGHWNPTNAIHGSRTSLDSHAGDMGNVTATADGSVKFYFITEKITLFGNLSIVGRGVVIHADEDDLGAGDHEDSLTTGHSGMRLDCAVIGIAEE